MAIATNWQLVSNTAKMEKGRIAEITATTQIVGITATDHQWVDQALAATGLPSIGSQLAMATGERLRLMEINPTLREGEQSIADATLIYRVLDGSSSEGNGVPVLTGGTALKSVQTSRYRDGSAIEVEHTWPANSKATFPDGSSKAGEVETVTATITVPVPMSTLHGEIFVQTATPGAISQEYAGKVNKVTWQNGAPRTWMCTECSFELVDNTSSPAIWAIRFSFEYDQETWDNDTTAFFIDPQTGMVPEIDAADQPLPNGKEVVQVEWALEKDFNEDF